MSGGVGGGKRAAKRETRRLDAQEQEFEACFRQDHPHYSAKVQALVTAGEGAGIKNLDRSEYSMHPVLIKSSGCVGVPPRVLKASRVELRMGQLMCTLCQHLYTYRILHCETCKWLGGSGEFENQPVVVLSMTGGVLVTTWRSDVQDIGSALHVSKIQHFVLDCHGSRGWPALVAGVDMKVSPIWDFFLESLPDIVRAAFEYAGLGLECAVYFGVTEELTSRTIQHTDAVWLKLLNMCSIVLDREVRSKQDAESKLREVVNLVAPNCLIVNDIAADGMFPLPPHPLILDLEKDWGEMSVSHPGSTKGDLCVGAIEAAQVFDDRLSSESLFLHISHPFRHFLYILFARRSSVRL